MVELTFKSVSQSILDSQKILDKTEAAEKRVLYRFGGFTRKVAERSMNYAKKIAPAGHTPNAHLGLIRNMIRFLVEADHNVVIGPMKINKPSGTALEALETGGQSLIMRHGKPKTINILPRPFMRPAFEKGIQRTPELWRDSIV